MLRLPRRAPVREVIRGLERLFRERGTVERYDDHVDHVASSVTEMYGPTRPPV